MDSWSIARLKGEYEKKWGRQCTRMEESFIQNLPERERTRYGQIVTFEDAPIDITKLELPPLPQGHQSVVDVAIPVGEGWVKERSQSLQGPTPSTRSSFNAPGRKQPNPPPSVASDRAALQRAHSQAGAPTADPSSASSAASSSLGTRVFNFEQRRKNVLDKLATHRNSAEATTVNSNPQALQYQKLLKNMEAAQKLSDEEATTEGTDNGNNAKEQTQHTQSKEGNAGVAPARDSVGPNQANNSHKSNSNHSQQQHNNSKKAFPGSLRRGRDPSIYDCIKCVWSTSVASATFGQTIRDLKNNGLVIEVMRGGSMMLTTVLVKMKNMGMVDTTLRVLSESPPGVEVNCFVALEESIEKKGPNEEGVVTTVRGTQCIIPIGQQLLIIDKTKLSDNIKESYQLLSSFSHGATQQQDEQQPKQGQTEQPITPKKEDSNTGNAAATTEGQSPKVVIPPVNVDQIIQGRVTQEGQSPGEAVLEEILQVDETCDKQGGNPNVNNQEQQQPNNNNNDAALPSKKQNSQSSPYKHEVESDIDCTSEQSFALSNGASILYPTAPGIMPTPRSLGPDTARTDNDQQEEFQAEGVSKIHDENVTEEPAQPQVPKVESASPSEQQAAEFSMVHQETEEKDNTTQPDHTTTTTNSPKAVSSSASSPTLSTPTNQDSQHDTTTTSSFQKQSLPAGGVGAILNSNNFVTSSGLDLAGMAAQTATMATQLAGEVSRMQTQQAVAAEYIQNAIENLQKALTELRKEKEQAA